MNVGTMVQDSGSQLPCVLGTLSDIEIGSGDFEETKTSKKRKKPKNPKVMTRVY